MLVLSRKVGEGIYIGNVKVTLVRAGEGKARIGIDAPRDLEIRREELPARRTPSAEESLRASETAGWFC